MTFDSVRPIFEYSRTWDFKAYKAQQHSVTTLREQMQRIGVWVNELEKMRARQPCGILEVKTTKTGEKTQIIIVVPISSDGDPFESL